MKWMMTMTLLLIANLLAAQLSKMISDEDGFLYVESIKDRQSVAIRSDSIYAQLDGFPKAFLANPTFKNFRGVALADLNSDGREEILIGINNQFMVWGDTELIWSKESESRFIYPPSIADLDNDGDLEIIQTTGGIPSSGLVFGWDHTGIELTGWPRSFDENWLITSAALEDVDGDKDLEVCLNERNPPTSRIHLIHHDGTNYGNNWPILIQGTPAVTPSIGDLDDDGRMDFVVASTTTLYAFDLTTDLLAGWPIENPDTKFSFQSPLLVDVDANGKLEIIGAAHGNDPEHYAIDYQGIPLAGWPIPVDNGSWTFSPPTIVNLETGINIFMAKPNVSEGPADVFFGWDANGQTLDNFPVNQQGGNEGFISVADIDADGGYEVYFSSNILDSESGRGYIYGIDINTGTYMPGFPLQTRGWTYMNGANLGDVNGDGMLDLVCLSYTQNFGERDDSTFINVFELNTPILENTVLWSTYKGSNSRTGVVRSISSTSQEFVAPIKSEFLYPNPSKHHFRSNEQWDRIDLYDLNGKILQSWTGVNYIQHKLPVGTYLAKGKRGHKYFIQKCLVIP